MKRSQPLRRSSPLRQKGAKARREQVERNAFRFAVRARAQGFCELQTPACLPYRHEGHHAHHLAPSDRDRGTHDPERGLWCCFPGHEWVHRHPERAYEAGWLRRDGAA